LRFTDWWCDRLAHEADQEKHMEHRDRDPRHRTLILVDADRPAVSPSCPMRTQLRVVWSWPEPTMLPCRGVLTQPLYKEEAATGEIGSNAAKWLDDWATGAFRHRATWSFDGGTRQDWSAIPEVVQNQVAILLDCRGPAARRAARGIPMAYLGWIFWREGNT
jgi:hypothetical protein